MGTDISGWVEIKTPLGKRWGRVVDIGLIIDRNYDAFGCLFGIKNYANFAPVAADRGLPADVSPQVRRDAEEMGGYAFGHTWVTWAELQALDLDASAEEADSRIHEYQRGDDGQLVYLGKAAWNRAFGEHAGVSIVESLIAPRVWPDGQEWEIDGHLFRAERLTRRAALGEDWQTLFGIMAHLAARYGEEHVRLTVWFDA